MKIIVNQTLALAPTVKTIFNNTAYAVTTKLRNGVGDYTVTFDGNIFADLSKISIENKSILFDNGAISNAVDIPVTGLGNNTMNIQTYIQSGLNGIGAGANFTFDASDNVLTQYVITINIEP
ncbi:MAG: hypothetical protein IPJ45_17790 [Ignavibacteria bacterium]|nr:hypothetical protein [Ignavibacteria bacterium]